MTVTDFITVVCAVAGFLYFVFTGASRLILCVYGLVGRVINTRLDRAANIVCEEMEKISGRRSGTVVINTERYSVEITVKPEDTE